MFHQCTVKNLKAKCQVKSHILLLKASAVRLVNHIKKHQTIVCIFVCVRKQNTQSPHSNTTYSKMFLKFPFTLKNRSRLKCLTLIQQQRTKSPTHSVLIEVKVFLLKRCSISSIESALHHRHGCMNISPAILLYLLFKVL